MTSLGGKHVDDFPSSYHFPARGLLVTCYVDDLICPGPASAQKQFWLDIEKQLDIETPSKVGRQHTLVRENGKTYASFTTKDYIENACQMNENLADRTLKAALNSILPRREPFGNRLGGQRRAGKFCKSCTDEDPVVFKTMSS